MNPSGADTRLPGARAVLALLLSINLLNYIDRYVLSAVVGDIQHSFFSGEQSGALLHIQQWCQRHFGFKPELAFIGVLSMAFMAVYMIGAPIFGHLAARFSRRLLIGIGVIGWTLASGASGLAPTFFALLLTRCCIGIGEAAWGPIAPTIISDMFPVSRRGLALAWFNMAIPVGSALGFALGGAAIALNLGEWGVRTFGIHEESWRWAFYLVVPPGLVLGTLCFFMREPPSGHSDFAEGVAPAKIRWGDYRVLARTPSYVLCTIGMTAMTFAIGGIAFWMPYFLSGRPGAPSMDKVSLIFGGIVCLAGLSATLLGGLAGDKLRARYSGAYFLVSGFAMLLGFPLIVLTVYAPFPWVWPLVFVTCFSLFFNTGPTNTILANVTHPSIRAVAFAVNIFIIHAFGDVISPVIIGILGDKFSMETAFMVVSVMFLVSAFAWLWGARHLARDTAHAVNQLD